MTKRLFIALLCLGLLGLGGSGRMPRKFDPRRDAVADLAVALSLAKADGKRVLVDVGGEWCTWCHVMEQFINANADIRQLVDTKYVWLKVNYSSQNKNEALLSRWPKVSGYPHLFVLDDSGKLLHSQGSSELEAGRQYDRNKMLAFLRRFAA